MKEIFVSYATADEIWANEIAQELERRQVKYFLARKHFQGGEEVEKEIKQAIRECSVLLVLVTPSSLRSEWVKKEYMSADALGKEVIPITLRCDPSDFPTVLKDRHAVDYHKLKKAVERFGVAPKEPWRSSRRSEVVTESPLSDWRMEGENHIEAMLADLDYLNTLFSEEKSYVEGDEVEEPLRRIPNASYDPDLKLYPKGLAGGIMIDTIHAGDQIIKEFVHDLSTNPEIPNATTEVSNGYLEEKDWGANHLAMAMTKCLNVPELYQVSVARVLLDYGRFPGVTLSGAGHLDRKAINPPFTKLRHPLKMKLLREYYNEISKRMESAVEGKFLKIAIHTYDPFDRQEGEEGKGSLRPDVSLVFSPIGYHVEKRMPKGIFDPLYPDELGVFSADRRLIARLTLDLEREGITVGYNYPYHLPEGSVEVRAMVWTFFNHLKREFLLEHEDLEDDEAYKLAWDMLLDTNFRSPNAELLRSYIHMFRDTPGLLAGSAFTEIPRRLEQAHRAYRKIGKYLKRNWERLVDGYRESKIRPRPSALVIEVRKDILWRYVDKAKTVPVEGSGGLKLEGLRKMTRLFSRAILTYLNEDRKDLAHSLRSSVAGQKKADTLNSW